VDERSVNYDASFPQYGTTHGILKHENPSLVHSSPQMWVDALDLLFLGMKQDNLPLGEIRAVSGSGQQHGSVYLTKEAGKQFREVNVQESLANILSRVLSRPTAPVWMDTSTFLECNEIRQSLGGRCASVAATGSDIIERFTGPQIRKCAKEESEIYKQTSYIALVSSLFSSVLAGQISPIDYGDGAGTNLMDIASLSWHPEALMATAPDLQEKLPPLAPCTTILGKVNPYLVSKYGLNPAAQAVIWTGDNPSSLIGTGLVEPGLTAISLGTSDTLFGAMRECRTDPRGEGHVFVSPAGGYMSLICFKNGSLAREIVKDTYDLDWDQFSDALRETPPGNNGALMLPWFDTEIVPRVKKAGLRRKDLSKDDVKANCRAVVEAQMLSMRLHSAWMGSRPSCIYATGGASKNREILQIMADVFGVPVFQQSISNSAALGAALRAAHAWTLQTRGTADWNQIVGPFTRPLEHSVVMPRLEFADVYKEKLHAYADFEAQSLLE
jgi:xylulokinase